MSMEKQTTVSSLLEREKILGRKLDELSEERLRQERFEEEVHDSIGAIMYHLNQALQLASTSVDFRETSDLLDDVRLHMTQLNGEFEETSEHLKRREYQLQSDLDDTRTSRIREEYRLEEERKEKADGQSRRREHG